MAAKEEMISGLIELPKSEVVLLLEAGYFLAQMEKYKEAYDLFTGVAGLLPHSDVPCVALGNVFFAQGKLQQALKEHDKAILRDPNSAVAYAHKGEILFFMKKFDEGIEALNKAIEIEPHGVPAGFARELLLGYQQQLFS